MNLNDLIGQKFDKLTILSAWRNDYSEIYVSAKCECGNITKVRYRNLTSGKTSTCGKCNKINLNDLIGQKFNKLTIISARREKGRIYVKAKCECGNIKEFNYNALKNGHTKSCGCINKTANGKSSETLYHTWKHIMERCYRKNDPRYTDWGGRGIEVCDEWKDYLSFKKWALNNGYQDNLSIDRIDNDKNYCPENCRWVTMKEQNRNKRNTIKVIFHGKEKPLKTLCEELNLNYNSVKYKLKKGIDVIAILEKQYLKMEGESNVN
jgi:hypothetical protein